jgi:deoxyribodipyrimidine photo-lyase
MNGELFDTDAFEPTPAAAMARLAAVRPGEYARTRNHLEGAVTRLSPYITHGLLTLPGVLQAVLQRHPGLPVQHKLVYELGWREYFHHVWRHEGEGIFASLHTGPLPDENYARELPADLREARTGVPVVDSAVRELYACTTTRACGWRLTPSTCARCTGALALTGCSATCSTVTWPATI